MASQDSKSVPASLMGHFDAGMEGAEPPYHVRTSNFLFVAALFDSEAVEAALPKGLEPKGTNAGFFGCYQAAHGWGLGTFGAFFVALEVAGYDSPDGSSGYLMAEGFYSGRAGPIMHQHYNKRLGPGLVRHWWDQDVVRSEAGPEGRPVVSLALRPDAGPRPPVGTGIHHYLGENSHTEGINLYSVAFSTEFVPAELVEFAFLPGASPLLKSLTPTEVIGTYWLPAMPLTFSAPRLVTAPAALGRAHDAQVGLVDLLSRIGRPAALVNRTGRLLFANREAEGIAHRILRDWSVTTVGGPHRSLLSFVSTVAGDPANPPEPLALEERELGKVVLVQALPVSAAIAGEPAALLLFADPSGSAQVNIAPTLELLGLSKAEAQVAALVGAGRSAREAAEMLDITANTARSTLQIVYEKLGIGKQSELGRIVGRLEVFGANRARSTAV